MARLNQIIAVVNGKKTETQKALTNLHRLCSSVEIFNGLSRKYRPLNDDDESFPDEGKSVQLNSESVLSDFRKILGSLMDVVATQDSCNCEARSDVVVDGKVILQAIPVTYLLFLEKQLNDVHKFISSMPVLDIGDTWVKDDNRDLYVGSPYETNRTKKILQYKVMYEATEQHPAQIEKWNEDKVVGKWVSQKFSGAMPIKEKNLILERVKKLEDAVKFARESANMIEAINVNVSDDLFNYILGL